MFFVIAAKMMVSTKIAFGNKKQIVSSRSFQNNINGFGRRGADRSWGQSFYTISVVGRRVAQIFS